MRGPVDEHADDLESTVYEGADEETAEFPDTGDELDVIEFEADDEAPDLDEDPSEL
jgi:hypothetical protein